MIVLQFLLTLLTIYVPALVGLVIFAGLALGGLWLVDEWDTTKRVVDPKARA